MGSCSTKQAASAGSPGGSLKQSRKSVLVLPDEINILDVETPDHNIIRLRNVSVSKKTMFYKVKVTHPESFAFDPSRGKILPESTIPVKFSYTPGKASFPSKLSFLLVTLEETPETESLSVDDAFAKVGDRSKLLQTTKVPIVFGEGIEEMKHVSIRPMALSENFGESSLNDSWWKREAAFDDAE